VLGAGDQVGAHGGEVGQSLRQVAEIFCWSLIGRNARSAALFVNRTARSTVNRRTARPVPAPLLVLGFIVDAFILSVVLLRWPTAGAGSAVHRYGADGEASDHVAAQAGVGETHARPGRVRDEVDGGHSAAHPRARRAVLVVGRSGDLRAAHVPCLLDPVYDADRLPSPTQAPARRRCALAAPAKGRAAANRIVEVAGWRRMLLDRDGDWRGDRSSDFTGRVGSPVTGPSATSDPRGHPGGHRSPRPDLRARPVHGRGLIVVTRRRQHRWPTVIRQPAEDPTAACPARRQQHQSKGL
jgi:hypothetical protein